jgi:hypothetical protein
MYDMGDCEVGASRCQNCDDRCQEPGHVCQKKINSCPIYIRSPNELSMKILKLTIGIAVPSFFFVPCIVYFIFEKVYLQRGKSEQQ